VRRLGSVCGVNNRGSKENAGRKKQRRKTLICPPCERTGRKKSADAKGKDFADLSSASGIPEQNPSKLKSASLRTELKFLQEFKGYRRKRCAGTSSKRRGTRARPIERGPRCRANNSGKG